MRGQVTTKPGIVTSNASVDQSFFSNSGLVDYHGGFGVSKAMDAPPMGPVSAHYEPVTEMASEQHPLQIHVLGHHSDLYFLFCGDEHCGAICCTDPD